jgi:hypothetical protein
VTRELHLPPFPPLRWDADETYFWHARGPLLTAFGPNDRWLMVQTEVDERAGPDDPSPEQCAAFAHLMANAGAVKLAALSAIRLLARRFAPCTMEELAARVELTTVHVLWPAADGRAHVGLEFSCFEYEHGIGVILHGARVVHVGNADDASDGARVPT